MENEKVKEIKEALYSWQESVMISTDENYVSHKVYNREILDYINELESENERLQWYFEDKDRDIDAYRRKVKELQHKTEVLERALKNVINVLNGERYYNTAINFDDNETYKTFIQQAEKEIENE